MKIDDLIFFYMALEFGGMCSEMPTHLNTCLIRKVNLLLPLPAIMSCVLKPNINAFVSPTDLDYSPPTSA